MRSSFKKFPNSLIKCTGTATVNKEMYIVILRRLRGAVRRKHSEKLRTNSWFLPHYTPPAHLWVLVKGLLKKNNVTTLEHPPYSPDLASSDCYLFPRPK